MESQDAPAQPTLAARPLAPKPKSRDPNKVFVAMPLEETMTRETSLFWESLADQPLPGIELVRSRVSGYGLPKARNTLTWLALNSDCGRMVNIDSDMKPNLALLARLLSHDETVPAVSGVYPKKRVDRLEWVGNFSGEPRRPDGLVPALDFGGGFCCLNLCALDALVEKIHDETWYVSEDDPFKDKIMWDLWACGPVEDVWRGRRFRRYLTEDFYFCWRLRRQLGVPVYLDTQCQVGHVGPVDFLEVHMRLQELQNQSILRAPGP